jgi:predicted metalloprotease
MGTSRAIAAVGVTVVYVAGLVTYAALDPWKSSTMSLRAASSPTSSTIAQASSGGVPRVVDTSAVPSLLGESKSTQRDTAKKMAVIGGHLNDYWKQQFAIPLFINRQWKPVETLWVDTNSTSCDGRTEIVFNDYFCPSKYYVEIEVAAIEAKGVPQSTPSRNFIIAHEWGHAVQHNAGVLHTSDKYVELQADCFAGAFLRYAADNGILTGGDVDVDQLHAAIRAIGDDAVALVPGSEHGTGAERVAWFDTGWNATAQACVR